MWQRRTEHTSTDPLRARARAGGTLANIAHTCVEATVRFAAELGYEVTMVRDATADYGNEEMHAALDVNIPNYASSILTTTEIVNSLSSPAVQ